MYRGWRSTKLHLALITMALATLAFAKMGWPPEQFPTYCMALGAAAGIFSGAAVMQAKRSDSAG